MLQSISADTCNFPKEIILADSSSNADAATIAHWGAACGARSVRVSAGNPSAARNTGARLASYPFLLFLDSDVIIRPGTLQKHFHALASGADACLGLVEFHGRKSFAWHVVEDMQVMLPFRYPLIACQVPWGPAANFSARKQALLRVGGFDERLGRIGGEDVDFGFRFTAAGFRVASLPDAVADHVIETWSVWKQNAARLYNYGRADCHLLIQHKERSYADIPSDFLLLLIELTATISLAIAWPAQAGWIVVAFVVARIACHALFATVKKQAGGNFFTQLAGPVVLDLLDLGKAMEAIRQHRIGALFRRVRYLDDFVARDWPESAAISWAIFISGLVFALGVLFVCAAAH